VRIFLIIILALAIVGGYLYFSNGPRISQSEMIYGASFSIIRATDLGLNWKEVYSAILNDLKVKRLRLAAYWPLIEPKEGTYDFKDMDYQMTQAAQHNVKVVLAVGRRLPGWPECHDPTWLAKYPIEKQRELVTKIVTQVVNRYKDSPALEFWQVENEPFFDIFARSRKLCPPFVESVLQEEIDLVHQLDPKHEVIITDGGELGTWLGAYRTGDRFGTSLYLYIWNSALGYMRYPISPAYFRIKHGITRLLYGDKPSVVIELQSEPWIPKPLNEVSIDDQLKRFDMNKMNELIQYPYVSGFDGAYLWGLEWWYWMKQHNHPEFWNRGQEVFSH
jgi:hypothetical protein